MNIHSDIDAGSPVIATDIDRFCLVNSKNEVVFKIVVRMNGLSMDVYGIDSCRSVATGRRVGPELTIQPIATNLVRISLGANE